jgi:hypothetical protein
MEAHVDHPNTSTDRRSEDVFGGGAGAEGPFGVEGHQPEDPTWGGHMAPPDWFRVKCSKV